MKRNLFILVTVFLLILVTLVFNGITGHTVAKPLEKVKIGDIPLTHNLPLYLALEKGYFLDEGLDAEVVRFDAPKQIVDAVVLNQVDLGGTGSATGISAIAESKQYGNLKYYAFTCNSENEGNSLLIPFNSDIKSAKDLEGKKIGQLPGIQWRTIITRILENSKVNVSSVTFVDLPVALQLQALQTNQIDALVALEPVTTLAVEKKIAKNIQPGIATKNIADPFCAGSGIISTKFLKEKPETAKKVLKVMQKAINEYNANENPELLVKYLKLDSATAAKLPYHSIKATYYTDATSKEKEAIQKFLDLFYEERVIEKRVLLEDVLLKLD